jgi:hypothetical protein
MPDKPKGITYVYRCDNRKCASFHVDVESDKGPIDYLAENKITKLCSMCNKPLTMRRLKYDRKVFRSPHIPLDLGEPADFLPEIIRKGIEEVEKKKKGRP